MRPRQNEVEDLNLIPLMNLFVTMIPLLLLTAAFYHIGMVSVSVPTQGSPTDTNVDTGKAAVTVNVRMTKSGYQLSASSATIAEDELAALDAAIPKKAGGEAGSTYDFETLSSALRRIKMKYTESETMMLIPDKTVGYSDMIKTMDAGRTMKVTVDGKEQPIKLFPLVVVSSLVE